MKRGMILSLVIFLILILAISAFAIFKVITQKSPDASQIDNSAKSPNAVWIKKETELNCIGFLTYSSQDISLAGEIGAGWIRPHPGPFIWGFIEKEKGQFDFSNTDEYVKQAQDKNIAILATVWPYADWDQTCKDDCEASSNDIFYPKGSEGMNGLPVKRCKPCDMDSYKNFLKILVERYDGDGINDMPELKEPIKYWEIMNEPEMQSETMTFFMGNVWDYIEILEASYGTIKETCINCRVLHAGAAGIDQRMLDYWGKFFSLNASDYFDIANIHYINHGDKSTLNVKDFRNLMEKYRIEKQIWVTEAEYENPDEEIKSSVEGALNAGASKIFFTKFRIASKGPPSGYSEQYNGISDVCLLER